MMNNGLGATRWAPLLALTALLAACGAAVSPRDREPAATPEPPATPEPTALQASCDDAAIRLPIRSEGVHGAILADTLHMGGVTAPATCTEPTNESLEAGLPLPEGLTAQVRQSRYYLIVIRYPGGNRLYIVTRRGDGTSCVVDLNDECIAKVTDLPDDFDLEDLPDDAPPTIPGGRPAPSTVSPPPAPSEPATPAAAAPRAAWFPDPSDGATNVYVSSPVPGDGDGSLRSLGRSVALLWEPGHSGGRGGPPATSYDVYWGTTQSLAADADLGTPIRRTTLTADIRPLAFGTTYYWRVDANNAAGTTRGKRVVVHHKGGPGAAHPGPGAATGRGTAGRSSRSGLVPGSQRRGDQRVRQLERFGETALGTRGVRRPRRRQDRQLRRVLGNHAESLRYGDPDHHGHRGNSAAGVYHDLLLAGRREQRRRHHPRQRVVVHHRSRPLATRIRIRALSPSGVIEVRSTGRGRAAARPPLPRRCAWRRWRRAERRWCPSSRPGTPAGRPRPARPTAPPR